MSNYIISHFEGDMSHDTFTFFFQSLKTRCSGKVVFLSDYPGLRFAGYHLGDERLQGVDVSGLSSILPVESDGRLIAPCCRQYYYIREMIESGQCNWSDKDRFFICDSRDVVFLGDIFSRVSITDKVRLYLEDARFMIRTNVTGGVWVRSQGEHILSAIGHERIICSGTMFIDGVSRLYEFIKSFTDLMTECATKRGVRGVNDQGVMNEWVYYRGMRDSVTLVENNTDEVLTMALVDPKTYSLVGGYLVLERGEQPSVLHQYDRHITPRIVRALLK
jgi:hypothetical protein